MSIELYWDNPEETVMLCAFDKNWTWDQMFETLDTIRTVTSKRDYEIGAIIDISKGATIPGGSIFSVTARENARKMLQMSSENGKGPIAVVGANGMMKTVAKAFGMLDKDALNDVYFTDTVNEARGMMNRRLEPVRASVS
jgi:ABC-type glycerol-3-phosphate transport system substrate-binding protein